MDKVAVVDLVGIQMIGTCYSLRGRCFEFGQQRLVEPHDGRVDDHERLIRLLRMTVNEITEWAQPFAASRLAEFDATGERKALKARTQTEDAANKLSRMTRYIELADQWYRSRGAQGDRRDAYELPGFALEAVTGLSDDVVLLIGSWVKEALGVSDADAAEVGRLWVDDVKNTAWRLLLEHGLWPRYHISDRTPVDP
ncbi:hypothetical protein [Saccharopolyspora sp. NPDC002376]